MPDADLWPRCCLAASQPAPSPVARPIKGPRSHLGDHPRSLQAASGRRSGEPLDLGVVDDEAEDGLAHILRLRAPHGECRSPAALSAAAALTTRRNWLISADLG